MKVALILAVAVILLLAIALFMLFQPASQPPPHPSISFSELLRMKGQLKQAVIRGSVLKGTDAAGRRFIATIPADPTLPGRLADAGTEVTIAEMRDEQSYAPLVAQAFWFIIYATLWLYPMLRIVRALERGLPPTP